MGSHVSASVDAQKLEAILENFVGAGKTLDSMSKVAYLHTIEGF
jgi:hypothetical protein